MPLSLEDILADTSYLARHNNNITALRAWAGGIESQLGGSFGAAVSVGAAFSALFGTTASVIGSTSYACSGVSTTLTVQPGWAWNPTAGMVFRLTTSTTLSFVGVAAGTYYITPNTTTGAPQRVTGAANALYSVVWTGSAFGTITRLANIVWAAADWVLARTSTAYGATYDTLDARLEATEVQVGSAGLARTAQTTRAVVSLAGVNVTLIAAQYEATLIDLTGTVTAPLNVVVPITGPRAWIFRNSTTSSGGTHRITVKTAAGAGVVLPRSGTALVVHDGSNTLTVTATPAPMVVASGPTPTFDWGQATTIRHTLTSNIAPTLTGAADGAHLSLELTQGGSGGYAVTLGAEVTFSDDLPSYTPSTAVGAVDVLGFKYHSATGKYRFVAVNRGF